LFLAVFAGVTGSLINPRLRLGAWRAKGISTASAVYYGGGSDWQVLALPIGEENR